jgi:hemolysin III
MNQVNQSVELPFGMYSEAEERANRLTHGFGCLLSICGTAYLLLTVSRYHDQVRLAACALYGLSLTTVYAMSTLSHCALTPRYRALFRSLDQGFIYFLIAGSVTPLAVAYLPTMVCWVLLGAMWTIASLGFLAKVVLIHQVDSVSVWVYIALGWFPVLASKWFIEFVPGMALVLAAIGGLLYTVGTLFLIFDERIAYSHAIWHLFVMTASTFHFLTILFYVAQ